MALVVTASRAAALFADLAPVTHACSYVHRVDSDEGWRPTHLLRLRRIVPARLDLSICLSVCLSY